jgi:hypothetical protein
MIRRIETGSNKMYYEVKGKKRKFNIELTKLHGLNIDYKNYSEMEVNLSIDYHRFLFGIEKYVPGEIIFCFGMFYFRVLVYNVFNWRG